MALADLLTMLASPPPLLERLAAVPGLYAVGGLLREAWQGRACTDIDLIAAADFAGTVYQLQLLLDAKPIALNERFNTRRFEVEGCTVDVSAMQGGSISADLGLRDYTINTLALELSRLGTLAAPQDVLSHENAFEDLENLTLRMVGRDNLLADPLRILRGYRFWVSEGFAPTEPTRAAWRELAGEVSRAAAERSCEELLAIFASPSSGLPNTLRAMAGDGVLWQLMPPLAALPECAQGIGNADVWTHTLECLEHLELLRAALPAPLKQWEQQIAAAWDLPVSVRATQGTLTRLGMLLHDVAKPPTREVKPDGTMSFYGHQEAGAEIAEPLLGGLRFASAETDFVLLVIREHLRLGYYSERELTPRLIYRYIRRLGAATPLMLLHGIADCAATRSEWARQAWHEHVRTAAVILSHYYSDDGVARPPLLLNGDAIMLVLGIAPGRIVGQLKDALLEATAAGEVTTVEEAQAWVRGEYERLQSPQ